MILSIDDRLELNIECITQLCGINVQMKNYIIQNIVKYFSNTKYAEYEDKDDCVIKIDNEVVGRKYFTTYYTNYPKGQYAELSRFYAGYG